MANEDEKRFELGTVTPVLCMSKNDTTITLCSPEFELQGEESEALRFIEILKREMQAEKSTGTRGSLGRWHLVLEFREADVKRT